jgi:hypothetical protein
VASTRPRQVPICRYSPKCPEVVFSEVRRESSKR